MTKLLEEQEDILKNQARIQDERQQQLGVLKDRLTENIHRTFEQLGNHIHANDCDITETSFIPAQDKFQQLKELLGFMDEFGEIVGNFAQSVGPIGSSAVVDNDTADPITTHRSVTPAPSSPVKHQEQNFEKESPHPAAPSPSDNGKRKRTKLKK